MAAFPALRFSVSCTTRPPRDGEIDGVHYHFLSREAFAEAVESGDLLEYEEVYPGRFYGTLRSAVEDTARFAPVLLDIDVRGAETVKQHFGELAFTVFVAPPSLQVLEERLRARGTETDTTLRTRLDRAAYEMRFQDRFDLALVNDDLDRATSELVDAVRAFLIGDPAAR
jgi:guanylate kinase